MATSLSFPFFFVLAVLFSCHQAQAQLYYRSLGCFYDSTAARILPTPGPQMLSTLQSCAALAVANRVQYFGLEYGGQCFYGSAIAAEVRSTGCSMPCIADPGQICGGFNAINLYSVTPPVTTYKSTTYIGCLTDYSSRILPDQGPQTDATVESCYAVAVSRGMSYFGLEFGGQCWYGGSLRTEIASNGCTMACTGKPSERCGGSYAIDVYRVNATLASLPYASYVGCYNDNVLRNYGPATGSTALSCALLAARNGASYFGLEGGGRCVYGVFYNTGLSNQCTLACTADPSQRCGGSTYVDVWRLSF